MPVQSTAPSMSPAPAARRPRGVPRRALYAAGGVAAVYVLVQLLVTVPGSGLGWDESVYTSQVDGEPPAAYFSAPRARGITYLVAPVASLTSSGTAVHVWFALLSGAGIFTALWVWRRLVPPVVLGWAGALFCTLWVTLFYGSRVMPNLWCAFAALAAVGCLLRLTAVPATPVATGVSPPVRKGAPGPDGGGTGPEGGASGSPGGAARRGGDRAALAGLAGCVAFVALLRPSDAAWLALALGGAVLLVPGPRPARGPRRAEGSRAASGSRTTAGARPFPGFRRPVVFAVLAAAFVLGCVPWVVEAYAHYGGLFARLHRAGEIQGGMGWNLTFGDQLRSLQGRTLCRPCDTAWTQFHTGFWWLALPLLTAAGIVAAHRAGRGRYAALATATALVTAVPYLFLIGYAAPRFLLPGYVLLAVPLAELAARTCTLARTRRRPLVAGLGVAALAGHLGIQYAVLSGVVQRSNQRSADLTAVAGILHRNGVRPPCIVSGPLAVPVAHYTGCASRQPSGHDESISIARLRELTERLPAAFLVPQGHRAPAYAEDRPVVPLPQLEGRAHLSPPAVQEAARGAGGHGG